ncbi:MAG TPA: pirin family protein [Candidatus Poseidoniales archaeon]|nr:pirin family protein [Candidatus Thermoplasmatota archaeon]DAC58219.1 MAG TPA: pirin family protein [Candidatus Poseidoniales archaeon]
MNRTIKSIVPTHTVLEGGGFKVRRPAAMGRLMSPFLLLDEMGPVVYAPGEAIGAPSHPHRGFETVTYLLDGGMKHADSAGNSGDLNPGDVQWMTAGRGVIHSELPQDHMMENGGRMHGFQIWVNLPAKDKMMLPRYQDIPSSDIPETTSDDGLVWAKVVAGKAFDVEAVIDTVIPITMIHLKMKAGATYTHACVHDHNVMLYAFGGSLAVEGRSLHDGGLGLLSEGDTVTMVAEEDGAELLILGGPELGEPIARYGPFVMNTRQEIYQAIEDYNNGTLA